MNNDVTPIAMLPRTFGPFASCDPTELWLRSDMFVSQACAFNKGTLDAPQQQELKVYVFVPGI